MPSFFRIIEVIVYALLNFLPFLLLALYPFRHSLRFSKVITGMLIGLLTVIQVMIGIWVNFVPGDNAAMESVVSTIIYITFYFISIKEHFGKALFTLLMISNFANLNVISAKCLEGLFFPTLALQDYRWSSSLMLFVIEICLFVPVFLYMKSVYAPVVKSEPSGLEWRYLWLIPVIFYLMWYYVLYGNTSYSSSLEIALQPKNTLFLFVINIGEFLIYYVVTRLILEQNRTMELQESNRQLTLQTMQYENLQEKINDARRIKHDVHHHIALIQEYLAEGKLDALHDYLGKYNESLPDYSLVRFCENVAANAVLIYFSKQAKDNSIDYIVKAKIPNDIFISDVDISVLLGNLVENALESCRNESGNDRKIMVCASLTGSSFCITVDNTFSGMLKYTKDGKLVSTKHKGLGLGTQSVKSIAANYNGVCRFETKDGMFYASVMCNKTDSYSNSIK